jgi:hypothetical protein
LLKKLSNVAEILASDWFEGEDGRKGMAELTRSAKKDEGRYPFHCSAMPTMMVADTCGAWPDVTHS